MELYHVCFAVQDIDAAMSDLAATVGARWREPRTGTLGEWTYRIAFSIDAPYFELIEGPPGSPWDSTTGPRFHHLGFWSDDMDLDRSDLDGVGTMLFDACPLGRPFSYHRIDSIGASVELVDRSAQTGFRTTWDL